MARPKKPIDAEQVRKLAAIHCSHEEIASILGCDKRTLERRFAADIKEGRDHGRMSLKRKQYEVAMNGNTTMLIWLGKQYLGQKDKSPEEIEALKGQAQAVQPLTAEQVQTLIKVAKSEPKKD